MSIKNSFSKPKHSFFIMLVFTFFVNVIPLDGGTLSVNSQPSWGRITSANIDAYVSQQTQALLRKIQLDSEYDEEYASKLQICIKQCNDLDAIGGQPIVLTSHVDNAYKWISDNLSDLPKMYLQKLPKTQLKLDIQKKERQDKVLFVIDALKKKLVYLCSNYEAVGLQMAKLDSIVKSYRVVIKMNAWRDIGDRQPKKVANSVNALCEQIEQMYNVTLALYEDLIFIKKQKHAAFVSTHPAAAQSALVAQKVQNAEIRVKRAEKRAKNAEMQAESARAEAAAARNAAYSAASKAAEANRKADDAVFKAQHPFSP